MMLFNDEERVYFTPTLSPLILVIHGPTVGGQSFLTSVRCCASQEILSSLKCEPSSTIPAQRALDGELKRMKGQRWWKIYPDAFERAVLWSQERRITYLLPDRIRHAILNDEDTESLLE
jgi:hypothetical protein